MSSYEKRTWWARHGMTPRLANEAFLEAAVTTAFLIAAADGSASEREYDALLDRLELLGDIERDVIDALVTNASHQLEESGFEPQIARVGELISDPGDAGAAMLLGLVIGLADDDFSAPEREIASQLATAMDLTPETFEELLAELRD